MNLLHSIKLIKKHLITLKKENGKTLACNNSEDYDVLLFLKPIKKKKIAKIVAEIKLLEGNNPRIILYNSKIKRISNELPNSEIYFKSSNKSFYLGIELPPNTTIQIEKIKIESCENDNLVFLEKNIENILISPGYPSTCDKYRMAFVHTRVLEYKKSNLDFLVINSDETSICSSTYYIDNVKVIRFGISQLRQFMIKHVFKRIVVHYIEPYILRSILMSDTENSLIFLYCHGTDILFKIHEKICSPYNYSYYYSDIQISFDDRMRLIKIFNSQSNTYFIFPSKLTKNLAENSLNINFINGVVIPSYINNDVFRFNSPNPNLRKKIVIIRPQNNLKTYAMDINVMAILELSRRNCFKDLEFSIYGCGTEQGWLLDPLRHFNNVHIYNKYLSHEEIATIHKQNGIFLCASRFETMGVSACEAAMSGKVVITSKNTATEEYIDKTLPIYCETENYFEYANIIEKLYNNESLYCDICSKIYNSVINTCSYKYSIEKDINLFKTQNKKIKFENSNAKPVISICVPIYNCGMYIKNLMNKIYNCKELAEIELILVNDGSKDDSKSIIESFINQHKLKNFKLIDKENGGHGSAINVGIEIANGKYFKVLDGDDYFVPSELDSLISFLKNTDCDLILNNYVIDNQIEKFSYHPEFCTLSPGVIYNLDDCCFNNYGFKGEIRWGPQLSTATYKTALLKNLNFKIDEKCSYDDMEYNLMGLLCCKTVVYYPLNLYVYYIGRIGQSISRNSFKKNISMHEIVCLRIIDEFGKNDWSFGKKSIVLEHMVAPLCLTQYNLSIDLFKSPIKFYHFNSKLKKHKDIYLSKQCSSTKIRLIRRCFIFFYAYKTYKLLKQLKFRIKSFLKVR